MGPLGKRVIILLSLVQLVLLALVRGKPADPGLAACEPCRIDMQESSLIHPHLHDCLPDKVSLIVCDRPVVELLLDGTFDALPEDINDALCLGLPEVVLGGNLLLGLLCLPELCSGLLMR
eukprot:CAMPEP_0179064084 /NCGR_PEP_ID=MMETSP0796-20121207/27767_1 /TAXON_ID=73915 /ORGANISM="Pyrodinium bahamense, Strain pbaha01" /LENGTH=119 /DNA_ID=CAMNT_0020761023 /DNA_START=114 /DNA_END=473 /DNA_ORIENTATION=-